MRLWISVSTGAEKGVGSVLKFLHPYIFGPAYSFVSYTKEYPVYNNSFLLLKLV